MRLNNGFLLFEVAIALLVLSSLSAIIAGFLVQTIQWQTEARARIEAIDYASSCCELLRQERTGASLASDNGYTITITKKPLKFAGNWSMPFSDQERKELINNFQCAHVTVEWQGKLGQRRSCALAAGYCKESVQGKGR